MWKQRAGIKSKKRITQQQKLRVIFGLMPALVFISFAKI